MKLLGINLYNPFKWHIIVTENHTYFGRKYDLSFLDWKYLGKYGDFICQHNDDSFSSIDQAVVAIQKYNNPIKKTNRVVYANS